MCQNRQNGIPLPSFSTWPLCSSFKPLLSVSLTLPGSSVHHPVYQGLSPLALLTFWARVLCRGGCPRHCGMFSSVLCLYPLKPAASNCHNPKYLQTLSNAPWWWWSWGAGTKYPTVEDTCSPKKSVSPRRPQKCPLPYAGWRKDCWIKCWLPVHSLDDCLMCLEPRSKTETAPKVTYLSPQGARLSRPFLLFK